MRKILLMVGIFLNSFAFCQVAEDFSDGELLHLPQWEKDTGRFMVNSKYQMQSKPFNKSDTAFISTANNYSLNTSWEFYVQINVDPSTSNQMRIYLTYNHANLDSSGNGYFIQIGETGSQDSYDLYRKTGKSIVKIIDGPAKPRSKTDTIKVWFYVIHRVDGYWELYSRDNPANMWDSEGNCFDRIHRNSNYMGISIKHTSTRSDKFILDELHIYPYEVDTFAPEYSDIEINDSIVTVLFSEEIDTVGLYQTSAYLLNNSNKPNRIYKDAINSSLIHIVFKNNLTSGRLSLVIPALSDLLGNKNDSSYLIHYNYIAAHSNKRNDVFISEIMADPSPPVDLPESEFIEWYNTSDSPINLLDWMFVNGSSSIKLKSYVLNSKSFIIFCKASDTTLWKPYGNVIGLSTWPSVGNTSGLLKIIDNKGVLIDEVNYNSSWYKNKSKALGGYSLENYQETKSCEGIYAWEASGSKNGGSPGSNNSYWNTNNQSTFYVYQFDYLNDSSIYVRFNKAADSTQSLHLQAYQLNNPTRFAKKINLLNDFYTEYIIIFNEKFKNNKTYQLKLNNIKTCDGQALDESIFSSVYRSNDDTSLIRINEIMLDPTPSVKLPEVEYIELYNASGNYIDMTSYSLNIGSTKLIFPYYLFVPDEYIIICASADSSELKSYGSVISFSNFPLLSNSSGTIQLLNKASRVIDRVNYKSSWYRDDTKTDGGWSLEFIDPYTKCNEINRWTASVNKRGGTPGVVNSVADFHADQKDLSVKYFKNYKNYQFIVGFGKPVLGYLINPAQLYFVGPKYKLYFPEKVSLDSPNYERANLTFNSPLPAGKYNLICQYIPSCGRNDTNLIYPISILENELPEEEIAASELMADPSPSNGLPECEYIELYNKSEQELNDYQFYIADSKDTVLVNVDRWPASSYLILCHKNYRASWAEDVHVIPLNKLPSFGNEKDTISILSIDKNLIEQFTYDVRDLPAEKREGGYAYVRINGAWSCSSKHVWQASKEPTGGSPGKANEGIDMFTLPAIKVLGYKFINEKEIRIELNEKLSVKDFVIIGDETTGNGNIKIDEQGVLFYQIKNQMKEAELISVKISITNCLGMQLDTLLAIYKKYIPKKNELLISEILFNPEPNGFDFVEIYNSSDKTVNVEDINLSNGKEQISFSNNLKLNNANKYIKPNEYRVFSLSAADVLNRYSVPKKEHLLEVKKMISMPDDGSEIFLLNENDEVIEQVRYNKSMHNSWISNTEGRSLERKRFEYSGLDENNWASATDNCGKASPTGKNSQYVEEKTTNADRFWLSKKVLRPFAESNNSALEINYNIEGETVFMNVKLFSVSGAFISEVMQGLSIRNSGIIKWDLANNKNLVPSGTYILSIECYSENGKNQQYKLPFAVHY